jgi:hypothetical protein
METIIRRNGDKAVARVRISEMLHGIPVGMPKRLAEILKIKRCFDEEYDRQLTSMDLE